jgi:hypothetical protein
MQDDASDYWKANIQPLLELNRGHFPRLEPDEQRLAVLQDAVIRVRNHLTKLYNLVLMYPQAFSHVTAQKRLGGGLGNTYPSAPSVMPSDQTEEPTSKLRLRKRDRGL